jgi:Holliday junction resolvase
MTEQIIQMQIMAHLRREGWYVNKLISTSLKGVPDLICHRNGQTVYLEVKRPGGKVRAVQYYRMDELRKYRIKSFVVHSLDEVKALDL